MEDFMISGKEHKLWKKFQKRLEKRYNVQIRMPNVVSLNTDIVFISLVGETSSRELVKKFILEKMNRSSKCTNKSVIVVTLSDSEEESPSSDDDDDDKTLCLIQPSHCTDSSDSKQSTASNLFEDSVLIDEENAGPSISAESSRTSDNFNHNSPLDDNVVIVEIPPSSEATRSGQCQQRRYQGKSAASNLFEDSVFIDEEIAGPSVSAESSCSSDNFIYPNSPLEDNVVILEIPASSEATRSGQCQQRRDQRKSAASNLFEDSVLIDEEIVGPCVSAESSRTSDNFIYHNSPLDDSVMILGMPASSEANISRPCHPRRGQKKRKRMRNHEMNKKAAMELNICDESIHLLEEAPSRTENKSDFIPFHDISKSHYRRNKASKKLHNFSLKQNKMSNDDIIVEETVSTPRLLRPVVIDGCNVAIEHGKVSNCFSSKGIKLAVDYFLNRGHTQVTAFVPKFRRFNNPKRKFPTKDPEILEDLAKKQYVVFTPSRRIQGKCIQSYDDRFIVQLAAKNGGVIVSNDYYRDLMDESDSFKKAIEERLLNFLFVGDEFMVPEDPLGRDGPKLSDLLCFPSQIL